MIHIGHKVKQLREASGLSQRELAEKLNSHQASISFIENGERGMSLDYAIRLAQALNVPISELVEPREQVPA